MSASERKVEQRRELIGRRRRLGDAERERADEAIRAAALALATLADFRTLAGFVAHRGEPDLMPALEQLSARDRVVCLPVVAGRAMHFREFAPDTPMRANRFGIPEPVDTAVRSPAQIDLVLVPLVGFAASGARLGMGAGYYDRAFAFRRGCPDAKPRLVGVAYAVQEVEDLPTDDWDVPLDGIITEDGLRWFRLEPPEF